MVKRTPASERSDNSSPTKQANEVSGTAGSPPKTDVGSGMAHVCFVPISGSRINACIEKAPN